MKSNLGTGVFAVMTLCATARAQTFHGTMCSDFKPGAAGCGSTAEAKDFDAKAFIYATQVANPLHKLVVFFHGHGGWPGKSSDFLGVATAAGYDAIDIDYDYGRDYQQPGATDAAHCQHPEGAKCVAGGREVCGCYSDCYGYRWDSIWRGKNHAGMPAVGADWTVDARLKATLEWMKGKVARFDDYLDSAQLDGINWAGKSSGGKTVGGITLAAHSMGTNLVGYIAKWEKVDRVVLLSGICDKLAPDVSAQFYATPPTSKPWGEGYGCKECVGTNESGQPYTFSGCSCHDTTFGYGAANNEPACTLSTKAAGWVHDNAFGAGSSTGTAWKTEIGRFYALADSDDHVCTWDGPEPIATQRNWKTLNLEKQHDAGVADGWGMVGDHNHPLGVPAGKYHGLLSTTIPGHADSQICVQGGISGHNATVGNGACVNGSAADNARSAIWKYMLTNP